jgi:CHAT domain-containing protein/tetratricopeptide (TPR) repeat protein
LQQFSCSAFFLKMTSAQILAGERRRPVQLELARILLIALLALTSCHRSANPAEAYDHARQTFRRGELVASQDEAEHGYREFSTSAPQWALKFRVLQAESLMWRGMSPQVLRLLEGLVTNDDRSSAISTFTLRGLAYARLHQFNDADRELRDAEKLCAPSSDLGCGAVMRARGVLSLEQGQFSIAQSYFEKSLVFARAHKDRFLEATGLLNLSAAALQQRHFDDAIDWAESARSLSVELGADGVRAVATGNVGWAYYSLGDSSKALDSFIAATQVAERVGNILAQVWWVTAQGYVFMDRRDYVSAKGCYQTALTLAQKIDAKEYILNALTSLAIAEQREGKLKEATRYSDLAIGMVRADGNRADELPLLLVKGHIAALANQLGEAGKLYREVAARAADLPEFKWEAQHSLARLAEDQNQRAGAARRHYEAALCTFETARSSVHHEESKLPFFTNAARIYDDYISFLVKSGQAMRALEVADYSRGRTLAEGLGYLKNDRPCATPPLMPKRVAGDANATILYYWLGQHQSYFWAITPHGVRDFVLPPASQIEASVRRYRESLVSGEDVVRSSNQDGLRLYQTLVAPALETLPKNSRVIIVPDGSLTGLNFETLLVPGNPTPHYWIEDAVIVNAQSLRLLLSGKRSSKPHTGKMLLVGDAVPRPPEFPALPNAKLEIQNIKKHFPTADLATYTQASATAASFLDSKPEEYSYIHFVAHAVASSQAPLDSAVILSPRPSDDSFKLYARDIIQHRLRARLVTVSACYGAGTRAYNGEGLIGLAWAFLRAGARNSIGALWEVNDASTPQLMDHFYAELKEGRAPGIALRDAKLSLMRSNKVFSKPFYWAPFQLYGAP